jgi:hypothetical protein
MRLTAPAIGAAAVVLAVALVAYFRSGTEPPPEPDRDANSSQPGPLAVEASIAAETSIAAEASVATEASTSAIAAPAPRSERAPLPGETPSTPMANLMAWRQNGRSPPPELIAGEHEFAEEPVDGTWARGKEADVLAKFAQIPGLKLIDLQVECRSTMCRLQLMQPTGGSGVLNGMLDSVAPGLEPRWMMTIKERVNGPVVSVAYLWREGFAPPKPEPGQPNESN